MQVMDIFLRQDLAFNLAIILPYSSRNLAIGLPVDFLWLVARIILQMKRAMPEISR